MIDLSSVTVPHSLALLRPVLPPPPATLRALGMLVVARRRPDSAAAGEQAPL